MSIETFLFLALLGTTGGAAIIVAFVAFKPHEKRGKPPSVTPPALLTRGD